LTGVEPPMKSAEAVELVPTSTIKVMKEPAIRAIMFGSLQVDWVSASSKEYGGRVLE
jgi:hypothetical protein